MILEKTSNLQHQKQKLIKDSYHLLILLRTKKNALSL